MYCPKCGAGNNNAKAYCKSTAQLVELKTAERIADSADHVGLISRRFTGAE